MKKKNLLFLFAALVLLGCMPTSQISPTPPSEFEADTQDYKILEGNSEIKIPEQATEVFGHVDGFRDMDTKIRFIISAGELDEFLNNTSCKLPLQTNDVRSTFQNQLDRTWWKPADALKFKWCHGEKEHLNQNILIDMTDTDRYIVYVMAQTK